MRYRKLGQTDIEVSEVGFGTWTIASDWWGEVADKAGMLHAAIDSGINFIDTAPVYGENGIGETLLADVLAANRSDIVVTTKCGYDIAAERRNGTQRERPHDWRPESIRAQLDSSLRRLGTD
ncbi:MAG: aldo/keto reductase, partial [Acidimicrobiia bacterium]